MYRYPDYLDEYACKCGACRRMCCTGRDWEIAMDARERDAALAELDDAGTPGAADAPDAIGLPGAADVRGLLASLPQDGAGHVALPMGEDGRCALLEPDGMCAWRRRYGRDLCAVCREFPIMYLRLFDDEYAFPSGGCEAVLEALARKRGRIEVRARAFDGCAGSRSYMLDVSDANAARDSVYGVYPVFVDLGLTVLQNEAYGLDQRMAILMTCLDVAAKMAQIGQCARLEPALRGMLDERRMAALVDGFARDAREGNPAVRACADLYACCLDGDAYAPLARRVLDGLGFSMVSRNPNPQVKGKLRLTDPQRLERGRLRCHQILERRADFMAKVMVSVYLHNGVPLANPDPWSNARYFALCYALVKFALAGCFNDTPGGGGAEKSAIGSSADGTPADEELIDVLVVVLRAFIHNSGFYHTALQWMDGLGCTDAGDFVRMVQW